MVVSNADPESITLTAVDPGAMPHSINDVGNASCR